MEEDKNGNRTTALTSKKLYETEQPISMEKKTPNNCIRFENMAIIPAWF